MALGADGVLGGAIVGGGITLGIIVAPFGNFRISFTGAFVGEIVLAFYEHTALFGQIRSALGITGLHVVNGLGLGLAAGLAVGLGGRSAPARNLRWSPFGFACGVAIGLTAGVVVGVQTGLDIGLIVGCALIIPAGYAGAIMFKGAEPDPTNIAAPTTVLRRDLATFYSSLLGLGLTVALGTGVVLGLSPTDGHVNGFLVGLGIGISNFIAAGLAFAFMQASWGSFTLARWWLAISGRLPRELMTFLADAHGRGVLRQVGAIYQFRHIELQRRLVFIHGRPNG